MTPTLNLIFCAVIIYQQMKQLRNHPGCLTGYWEGYAKDPSWSHLRRHGCFHHSQEQNIQACKCGWELSSVSFWSCALCLPTYYNWGAKTQQDETFRLIYYLYNHPTPFLLFSLRLFAYPQFILPCPSFIFLSRHVSHYGFHMIPCHTTLLSILSFQVPLSLLIIDKMKYITLIEGWIRTCA